MYTYYLLFQHYVFLSILWIRLRAGRFFFSLFHPKSLRINANCILRYQGNFSSCVPTVFYCARYHVLGVIFLIWVKPMQGINCVLLLVLLFFSMLVCMNPPKEIQPINKTAVYYSVHHSWGRVCEKFIFASVSQAFCEALWKNPIPYFYHNSTSDLNIGAF